MTSVKKAYTVGARILNMFGIRTFDSVSVHGPDHSKTELQNGRFSLVVVYIKDKFVYV